MSLIRRNNLFIPSIFNELANTDWYGGTETLKTKLPAVNIKENEKNFEIELSVPGFTKEDFNIEVDKNVLTISSEIKKEESKVDENYTRKEFEFSSFKRAFTLPDTVDVDKIHADYVNGVMKFELPKKEEALPKPKRLIALK